MRFTQMGCIKQGPEPVMKVNIRGGTGEAKFFASALPQEGTCVRTAARIELAPGASIGFHRHEDDDPFSIGHLFDGYRDFVRIFLTLFLQAIYIFLWALLLIIPGIIKALSYAMTPFILRDRPDLQYNGAIELSMAMMKGHKWDLFWLYLSFIGWAILCLFTFFIGYFWLEPYVTSTMANFYEEVKAEYEGRVFEKPAADFSESNYSKEER